MAESRQSYQNHTRFFPPFHFIAVPILLLNLINELRHVWANPNLATGFAALVAFGILTSVFAARLMALKVQDRVIRLELRQRLPRVLAGKLASQKAIKLAIKDWQGDHLRA